ncbi:putative signal transducing protein [Nocardioides sp. HB32]|jgi:Putative prokaryotic signal transducing protein
MTTELIRTNDLALIAVVEALLNGEEIPVHVADRNASVIDGSLQFIQMRILVPDDRADEARDLIREADLGEWLRG